MIMVYTGFQKKLEALATNRKSAIVNNFYWSVASTSSGNREKIKPKCLSLEHHVYQHSYRT